MDIGPAETFWTEISLKHARRHLRVDAGELGRKRAHRGRPLEGADRHAAALPRPNRDARGVRRIILADTGRCGQRVVPAFVVTAFA